MTSSILKFPRTGSTSSLSGTGTHGSQTIKHKERLLKQEIGNVMLKHKVGMFDYETNYHSPTSTKEEIHGNKRYGRFDKEIKSDHQLDDLNDLDRDFSKSLSRRKKHPAKELKNKNLKAEITHSPRAMETLLTSLDMQQDGFNRMSSPNLSHKEIQRSRQDRSYNEVTPNYSKSPVDDSINFRKSPSETSSHRSLVSSLSHDMNVNKRSKSVSWGDEVSREDHFRPSGFGSDDDLRKICGKHEAMETSATDFENHNIKIKADFCQARYEIVTRIARQMGFVISSTKNNKSDLIWIDDHVSMEMVSQLHPQQKINHFPAMECISLKHLLAKQVTEIICSFPNEYSFYPRSWLMPNDKKEFQTYQNKILTQGKKKILISRPVCTNKSECKLFHVDDFVSNGKQSLVQEFVENSLDLDQHAIHLRCFALILSFNPLRIFMFRDVICHITDQNFHPKTGVNTTKNVQKDHKKIKHRFTIVGLKKLLNESGMDSREFWGKVGDIVIKTVLLAHCRVTECYSTCRPLDDLGNTAPVSFELLAFDLMIDQNYKMWLISVHQSPNLKVEDDVDLQVKGNLVSNLLQIIRSDFVLRKNEKEIDRNYLIKNFEKKKLSNQPSELLQNLKVTINLAMDDHPVAKRLETKDLRLIFPLNDSNKVQIYMDILKTTFMNWEKQKNSKDLEVIKKQKTFLLSQMQFKIRREMNREQKENIKLVEIDDNSLQKLLEFLNKFNVLLPGTSEQKSSSQIQRIQENFDLFERDLLQFWFVSLNGRKQRNIVDIAMGKLEFQLTKLLKIVEPKRTKLHRICCRVFNRLLFNHGRDLWNSFHGDQRWEQFLKSNNTLKVSKTEKECCKRMINICFQCLLATYLCSDRSNADNHSCVNKSN